ncbi:hypothetical protein [Fibrella aquatilis]|uniref:Neuropeptide-like protein 29 n=1 Tax=Fibrella aquatilis TaxID=2817059 RepID=A0A939G6V4_9BACT|nr:hypothetical protein [Fibrella aquatilis]MBO0932956.1 hypothetical protein [Fibrella aquatilis]
MKNSSLIYTALSLVLVLTLWSCGPSYVGVRTGYGPGYYGARPYGYGYRPPVIIAPRPYVVRPYYRGPSYGYRNYGPRYGGFGSRRGWR